MELSEVGAVKYARTDQEATELLETGWELLQIVPAPNLESGVIVVVGRHGAMPALGPQGARGPR